MTTNPFDLLIERAADLAKRGGGTQEIASIAVVLARHIREAQDALEPLKGLIRDLARRERAEDGHHVGYEVPEGRVSVTFPAPRYEAKKDVNWDTARDQLGREFNTFFRERVIVTTQRDIEDLLINEMERAQDSNADTLLQYIERDEPTPRVGFKPAS
jgi:hypothetical protein